VIYLGIDDTDTLDTAGTNQLARLIAARLPAGFGLRVVLRHQLLDDPRIPYTSQNGSASLTVSGATGVPGDRLLPMLQSEIRAWFTPGSDPGLCLASAGVPAAVVDFGRRCQREVVSQAEARALALRAGLHLEDFGGTGDGVIGALAAVGLAAGGDDGRVVHLPGWGWPDTFGGCQSVAALRERGIEEIRDHRSGVHIPDGLVDVGKRLRPAYRGGRVVLFVERHPDGEAAAGSAAARWRALKLR
jgi:hypothetical protein